MVSFVFVLPLSKSLFYYLLNELIFSGYFQQLAGGSLIIRNIDLFTSYPCISTDVAVLSGYCLTF